VAAVAVFEGCQTEEYAAYFKCPFPNFRSYLTPSHPPNLGIDTMGFRIGIELW
jgi:hypothetical protein